MNKHSRLFKLLGAIPLAFALAGPLSARSATVDVDVRDSFFSPATVTINVGDTVRWTQRGFMVHTTTSEDGLWNSGNLVSMGQTFTHTFNSAGNFGYFCIPHSGFMRGTVIVEEAQANPPTVSITSPANGTMLTAPAEVTITATASVQGGTITSVEFLNGTTSLGVDQSSPYSVTTTLGEGTHTLTARATSDGGLSTTSSGVTVTVNAAPNAPVVTITSPANGAMLTAPAEVTITADASVQGGTITSVEFLNGTTSLGVDQSSPYSVTTTLGEGTHTLTARATSDGGLSTTSSGVTVMVHAPASAPVVSITAPADGATLPAPGEITITADATVQGSTITSVEFFDGTTSLGSDTSAPWSITVTLAAGTHSLTARAASAAGGTTTSAAVSVTVNSGSTQIENPFPDLIAKGDTTIELVTVIDGLVSPLGLAAPDDETGRLFIYEQTGVIHVLENGTKLPELLLDVSGRLVDLGENYDERGLLGLALHPDFANNPLVYTYTSEPVGPAADFPITPDAGETINHQSVIAEWRIDAANPNRVDTASRREIMRLDQPQGNHNGGVMHFGPDGFLYVGLGDGGRADDQGSGHSPGGNGQDNSNLLGTIIRIDVDARTSANGQYGVPAENPFVGVDGLDAIYAYGFRNPFGWSFDSLTGELLVADVGQGDIEELDRVFRGGNYGWPVKEGSFYFDMNGDESGFVTDQPVLPVPPNLVDPIAEYDHDDGLSIVGGYVYRGTALPNLTGTYITGDFGTFGDPAGRLFYLDRSQFKEFQIGLDDRPLGYWLKGFGQDQDGEVYVFASGNLGPSGTSGIVLKIVPADHNIRITDASDQDGSLTVSWENGVGPFMVQAKSRLNDQVWHTIAASATTSAIIPMTGDAGFLRIVDAAGNAPVGFTAHLTGAAERPNPVDTPAMGSGTFSLEGNTLHFDIYYSDLIQAATMAHIHGPAPASGATGVLIDLGPYNGGAWGTSGTISGSVDLSPAEKAHILNGKTYVNIHTGAHGGGEIRGQIIPVLFAAELTGAAERPNPVDTDGHGLGLFLLSGNQLTFNISYNGLSSVANNAHIHGPAGVDESIGVLVPLASFNGGAFGTEGTLNGTVELTPDQLAHLVDGLTYVNIHSVNHGPGEIRGQVIPKTTAVALSASLSGAAERPDPVDTTATGNGVFALEGDTLYFSISYTGLKQAATMAHIHGPASAEEPAGVLIDLGPFRGGDFGTSGTFAGSVKLTPLERSYILQGLTYVNVHSGAHGGGEIRGQIAPVVLHSVMLGASEHPAIHTEGSGQGTLLLIKDQLTIGATYSNLSSPSSNAHIHGPADFEGSAGVLVGLGAPYNGDGFGATSGALSGTVTLTPENLARVIDERTYINVHTQTHGGGEIRGQIVR